jgi:hypothetical protein
MRRRHGPRSFASCVAFGHIASQVPHLGHLRSAADLEVSSLEDRDFDTPRRYNGNTRLIVFVFKRDAVNEQMPVSYVKRYLTPTSGRFIELERAPAGWIAIYRTGHRQKPFLMVAMSRPSIRGRRSGRFFPPQIFSAVKLRLFRLFADKAGDGCRLRVPGDGRTAWEHR